MRFFVGVRLEADEHAVIAFCDCFADRTEAACLTTAKLAFRGLLHPFVHSFKGKMLRTLP